MKKALIVLGEFVVLMLCAVAALVTRPFHVTFRLSQSGNEQRAFDADWLIAVLIGTVLFIVIGAVVKRGRSSAQLVAIASLLTVVIGFIAKFGFRSSVLFR